MKPTELTEAQRRKVNAKILKLFNEKKYAEGAKLMVAMAVAQMDPDEFTRQLCDKIQEYKKTHGSLRAPCKTIPAK